MKRKLLSVTICSILLLISGISFSQTWQWAKTPECTNMDYGTSIATDAAGNSYLGGVFMCDSAIFGNITVNSLNYGGTFLVKYDSLGNAIWGKCGSADTAFASFTSYIATDPNGNVIETGTFSSHTIKFDNYTLTNNGVSPYSDMYIVKYDSSGNVLWAHSAGGMSLDRAYAISTDNSGNIYVVGFFTSISITFGSVTLTNLSSGRSIFIVKYDGNGNAVWAQKATPNGSFLDTYPSGIVADGNNNAYITGYFESTSITFGSVTLNNSSFPGNASFFIARCDNNGNFVWAQGTAAASTAESMATAISIDAGANLYATGYFSGISIIGSTTLTATGAYDPFVAKYDSSGNSIWAKSINGSGDDESWAIVTNQAGYSFITGFFNSSTINFGTALLTNQGNADIFICAYSPAGNELNAINVGGTHIERGRAITLDNPGNLYVAGEFGGSTLNFDSIVLTNLNPTSAFIAKSGMFSLDIPTVNNIGKELFIYPNPANDVIAINSTTNFHATEVILFDSSGREVMEKNISSPAGRSGGVSASFSVKHLNSGIYFYKIKDAKGNEVRGKMVKE